MLPLSLQSAIEFYNLTSLAAASVQDNLLFGRIAADQAGAAGIQNVIHRVLTQRGLDGKWPE